MVKEVCSHFLLPWFVSMNVDILKRLSKVLLTNYSQMASNNVTLIYSYYEFQLLHAGHCVLYFSYLNFDFHKYLQSKQNLSFLWEIRSLRFREVGWLIQGQGTARQSRGAWSWTWSLNSYCSRPLPGKQCKSGGLFPSQTDATKSSGLGAPVTPECRASDAPWGTASWAALPAALSGRWALAAMTPWVLFSCRLPALSPRSAGFTTAKSGRPGVLPPPRTQGNRRTGQPSETRW